MKFHKHLFLLSLFIFLSACYYRPFVGYTFNKKGFKHFSKQERLAGDNSNEARNYRVNRYDWDLEVFPDKKRIAGIMDITITTLETRSDFLFDLQHKMKILAFSCGDREVKVDRRGDLLSLNFKEAIPENTRLIVHFEYEGKPANVAGEGPIQWKEDEQGRPWISSVTEGIGPQFIMPCNALLRAECDTATIDITVPKELTVAANGKLIEVVDNLESGTRSFKHLISNRINTYSLSFNIAHFVKLGQAYTDITGTERTIDAWVLDYNKAVADSFYNQVPSVLSVFENMYGPFPFWEDGCKFIESTFSAMEHQSGIAMGDDYRNDWKDYNLTLVHELSHEWWGNSVTGYDYCDVWIHEGMATYSEALFLEKAYSFDDYEARIRYCTLRAKNKIPVLKECGVLYNSWVNYRDQDIYSKGALMMHSLRKMVNDDPLFFQTLKDIQTRFKGSNVGTPELIAEFNKLLGDDYSLLFDCYLNETDPPVLLIKVDKEDHTMQYRWEKPIPFYPDGEVFLKAGEELVTLKPRSEFQTFQTIAGTEIKFLIPRSIYYRVEVEKS